MSLVQAPTIPTIDDVTGSAVNVSALISLMKTRVQKASRVKGMLDIADDEETTDVGQTSASDNDESSSGMSGNEGSRIYNKRCRFGKTALETIPGTPSAFAVSQMSPAGVSRAALRQARDSCQPGADAKPQDTATKVCRFGTTPLNTVPKTPSGGAASQGSPPGFSRAAMRQARDERLASVDPAVAEVPVSTSGAVCRFGETALDTVPKTPVGGVGAAKLKALKSIYGSPPGLSHTSMRQERDACKTPMTSSWGASTAKLAESPPVRARGALARIKQEASLLKELTMKLEAVEHSEDEDEFESFCDSSSEAESSPEVLATTNDQSCRFDVTTLGTVPSTPLGGKKSMDSPPGFSRTAMRQARDAARKEAKGGSWASCKGSFLTTSPAKEELATETSQVVGSVAPR